MAGAIPETGLCEAVAADEAPCAALRVFRISAAAHPRAFARPCLITLSATVFCWHAFSISPSLHCSIGSRLTGDFTGVAVLSWGHILATSTCSSIKPFTRVASG
jgi:hypothetical protein